MKKALSRRSVIRLVLAWTVLVGALACGGTTCDCVTPLEEPIAEDAKLYDAVQARLTSEAFDFIENNLVDIISMFMEGGLTFDVPRSDQSMDILFFTINLIICNNGCTLTAEIVDAVMTPVGPDTLAMDITANLTGTITLSGTFDCDIPVNVQNKPVHADVRLLIDPDDHLMSFEIAGVSMTLESSDYNIACDWGFLSDIGLGGFIDDVVNWILGLLTGTINNLLADQLDSALDGALDGAVCMGCDFYTGGCPSGSSCGGDYCEDGNGCLTNPLGMVGSLDLGELLGDISPGMQAELDLFVAAGQWDVATIDPLVVNNGVEIRMIGGADTVRNECIPEPDPAEIPSNQPPARLIFEDTVPGTADTYMAGIGISDAFLDWFMYKVYLSGLLCLSIGTETTDMLTSATISLMGMGSLNTLTTGRNVPVSLKLIPGHVPFMEIGAGTFTEDDQGNRIIDEPLLYIFLPGVGLDFYVLIDERWTRVLTVTLDITLDVGLDLDQDNMLVPLFGEDSIHLENVVVSNYELLAEDPDTLANLIPTLVGMALPMLTGAIAPIEMPPIEGFALEFEALKGVKERAGTDYYEYLGLYANLSMADAPPPPARHTWAKISDIKVPLIDRMSIRNPDGPMYPEVLVEVAANGDEPAEFSYRVDDGFWRPYSTSSLLRVHDPRLLLIGQHSIEVRARTVGAYRTLDPTPIKMTFKIEPPDLEARKAELLMPSSEEVVHQTVSGQAKLLHQPPEENQQVLAEGEGCACSSASSMRGSFVWMGLLGLLLLRRRKSRN
jgi:MYXO-CTERM domain-containing protein